MNPRRSYPTPTRTFAHSPASPAPSPPRVCAVSSFARVDGARSPFGKPSPPPPPSTRSSRNARDRSATKEPRAPPPLSRTPRAPRSTRRRQRHAKKAEGGARETDDASDDPTDGSTPNWRPNRRPNRRPIFSREPWPRWAAAEDASAVVEVPPRVMGDVRTRAAEANAVSVLRLRLIFSRASRVRARRRGAHAVAYHARSCGWLDARVGVGFELASYATAVDAHGAGLDAASAGAAARAARECSNPLLATLRAELSARARVCSPPRRFARVFPPRPSRRRTTPRRARTRRAPPRRIRRRRRARRRRGDGARACRAWPCYVYAFAAPTDAAVATLGEASDRWVEVGAGTGYWASLMRAAGMDVVAVDSDPPGCARGTSTRGGAAGWTEVVRGGTETPLRLRDEEGFPRALFLCYPPPNASVASEALDSLLEAGGRTVAVVGEWDGNTADAKFAHALSRSFRLARRRRLPQWGDTAHELTVWTRRDDVEDDENDENDEDDEA